MTIDWTTFVPALLLLLVPGSLFYRSKVRYRDIARDWDGYWPRMLAHGLHYIDFARAALGSWLLFESLHVPPTAHGLPRYYAQIAQGGIRILAVILQTAVCPERDSAVAPFAFAAGLLMTGYSPIATVFALVLAIAAAAGARAPATFFPLYAAGHLGLGVMIAGMPLIFNLIFGALAVFMPVLWSMLFRVDLVVPYRAKRTTDEDWLQPAR